MPLVILLPSMTFAKNFSVDLSAAAGSSDNALKTSEDELSEKQNRYSGSVKGDWLNRWVDASVQYTATKETFADDSQEGENYLQGDSSVKFGNSQDVFNLDLRHSRRTLLKDISQVPGTSNQEEREIYSVMPSARLDISGSDELVASVDATRTRYLESETRDSDRNSLGLDYQHDFSTVDSFNIRLKTIKSEFLNFPQADYKLNTAAVVYQVSLRKLSYSFGAGQDQVKPEIGEEYSAPHYEASLNYKTGTNQFGLFVDQSVTDSSFGQGMELEILGVPGVDAVSSNIELIKRRTSGLNFTTSSLCARCDLNLALTHSKDDYIESEDESTQKGASISFRYNFSPRALLLMTYGVNDQQPVLGLSEESYRQAFSRVSFRYEFLRSFNLEIFTEQEKRTSDAKLQDYTENFTGLALAYHFE